ncbi:uncharacterized protein [Triticum aestivum]|uniref:uncharacterized protein n=1 Tax=Triticum aestivum TaxID=4565 RepID=UPI001D011722|nr:uncharacterized protein LOC123089344 [Triticum aestivum]
MAAPDAAVAASMRAARAANGRIQARRQWIQAMRIALEGTQYHSIERIQEPWIEGIQCRMRGACRESIYRIQHLVAGPFNRLARYASDNGGRCSRLAGVGHASQGVEALACTPAARWRPPAPSHHSLLWEAMR